MQKSIFGNKIINSIIHYAKGSLITIISLCVVIVLLIYFIKGGWAARAISMNIFYAVLYGLPLSFINPLFAHWIDRRMSWTSQPRTRAIYGFLGHIIISLVVIIIVSGLYWVLWRGNSWDFLLTKNLSFFYLIGVAITIIITGIYHMIAFFRAAIEAERKNQMLAKENIRMELNALQNHLAPHFLFNSLNILYSIIDENPQKARNFTLRLSQVFRYFLENKDHSLCTVANELEFADRYMSIAMMRYEEAIIWRVEIPDSVLQMKIPSLSLQMLLENALKHNVYNKRQPLSISVQHETKYLVVENNINAPSSNRNILGNGLKNIKSRYKLLGGIDPVITNQNDHFIVKLPLI